MYIGTYVVLKPKDLTRIELYGAYLDYIYSVFLINRVQHLNPQISPVQQRSR